MNQWHALVFVLFNQFNDVIGLKAVQQVVVLESQSRQYDIAGAVESLEHLGALRVINYFPLCFVG